MERRAEQDLFSGLSLRAPLLWVLLPWVLGLILARYDFGKSLVLFIPILGIGCITLALALNSSKLWGSLFILGVVLTSWGYGLLFFPSSALPKKINDRFGIWSLQVDEVFSSSKVHSKSLGIGRLINMPEHLQDFEGVKVYYQINDKEKAIRKGSIIGAQGKIEAFDFKESPTDFKRYLENNRVFLQLSYAKYIETLTPASTSSLYFYQVRKCFESWLGSGDLDLSHQGLKGTYIAMVLGQKSELSREQKQAYLSSGTMHLFAISGLHVGVVALSLSMLFQFFRVPSVAASILGLCLLYCYVQITGAGPSAQRAFIMAVFFWGGRQLQRKATAWTSLVASAVFILIWKPWELFSLGFQLSYIVVAGIILYGLPLSKVIYEQYLRHPYLYNPEVQHYLRRKDAFFKGLSCSLAISVAANIVCAPLCMQVFHVYGPGGIIVNMILVLLASLVIVNGFIVLFLGWVPGVAAFLNHGAWVLIYCMEAIIEYALYIPGVSFPVGPMSSLHVWLTILLVFAAIIFIAQNKKARNRLSSYALVPAVLFLSWWLL